MTLFERVCRRLKQSAESESAKLMAGEIVRHIESLATCERATPSDKRHALMLIREAVRDVMDDPETDTE